MSQIDNIYNSLIYKDELLNTKNKPIICNPAYEIISCNNYFSSGLIGFVNSQRDGDKGQFVGYSSSGHELHKHMYFSGLPYEWDNWSNNQGCIGAAVKRNDNLSSEYTCTLWINPDYPNYINQYIGYHTTLDNYSSQSTQYNISPYLNILDYWVLIGIILKRISNTQMSSQYFIYDPIQKNFQLTSIGNITNNTFSHYVFLQTPKKVQDFTNNVIGLRVYDMKIFDKALTESEIKLLGDSPIIVSKN